MTATPLPPRRPADEAERLRALRALGLVDAPPEERFDRITRTAARLLDVPIAAITLVDAEHLRTKSSFGAPRVDTPREQSFCAHAILDEDVMVVPDAAHDDRFAGGMSVQAGIRFYAGRPLLSADGQALGTLCVLDRKARTLTPEQQTQLEDLAVWAQDELRRSDLADTVARLRQSEARLWTVAESVAEGIVTFSASGEIRFVNSAARRMVGRDLDELLGQNVSVLVQGVPWEQIAAALTARAGDGDDAAIIGRRQVVTGHRSDGSTFPCEMVVSEARVDGERLFIGIGQDISHRHEAQRLKDEFVSVVGHELRTPLTSIRGSLGLLAGGLLGELPDEASQMVQVAVANTDRLVRLVNDMLDLERMSAGRTPVEPVVLPAFTLVAEAVQALQATAEEAGVAIETATDPDLLVWADGDRIVQTLVNLIGNAVKFSPRGATVRVEAHRDGHRALLSVVDRGRGIPVDELEDIFERFHQVDASDAREKGGTGLGLAIAREIVERHGGSIWAQSDGVGSTLSFTLKLAEGAVTLLLCGDDDGGDAVRVAELLERLGISAVRAVTPRQAAPLVRGVRPAAVLIPLLADPAPWVEALVAAGEVAASVPVMAIGPCALPEAPLGNWLRDDDGGAVVLEDAPELGDVLARTLGQGGAPVRVVGTEKQALRVINLAPPAALLLDLQAETTGSRPPRARAVADRRRGPGGLSETPVFGYAGIAGVGAHADPIATLHARSAGLLGAGAAA